MHAQEEGTRIRDGVEDAFFILAVQNFLKFSWFDMQGYTIT